MSDYTVSVLSRIGIEGFVALSAYLLLLMGRLSFGQQAFFALGAYGAGIATALYGAPLWLGVLAGTALATAGALVLALLLAPVSGLAFAVGSLAFAELVRLALLGFTFQRAVGDELLGPLGAEGFRGIRLVYVSGLGAPGLLGVITALLAVTLLGFVLFERTRWSAIVRMIGEDAVAAATVGIRVRAATWLGIAAAGALAGLGGTLFAHWGTYVEPGHAEVMLGVHSLAYGLIGGLGTPLGPILGVALDIGLLESFRPLQAYRMILFGGIVVAFLIVRPRGVLDEATVHALAARLRRLRPGARTR
ncbi:MAG: branched-chain amino acid ABC transporter permease [Candidatus Rokubacteria bacterium]|nr:branched-chain amino acid ABC transporter permease [Candidatus Rokubacteria bacterium]